MSKVSISSVVDDLSTSLAQAIEGIGGLSVSGDTVLIKPNLVLPVSYKTGEITNPYLVEAMAKWCFDHGAHEVIIGEGPGYYQPVSQLVECFTRTGIKEIAERTGARWVLFDEHPYKTFCNIADCTPSEFRITTYAFDCDKIINMPVMKTHYQTTVTLAMKNLKGCLKREDKPKFHHIDLNRAIVELNKIVRPSLNVVDGSVALAPGPGAIVLSEDVVAADSVSCALMGIDPHRVRTVLLGAEAGLGEMDMTKMDISGEELKRLKVSMALPKEELKRRFPLLQLVGAEKACSGCLIPLFSALSFVEEGTRMKRAFSIVIGIEPDIKGEGDYILIGDCTKACWEKGIYLEGCPPDKEDLVRLLRQQMAS